MTLKQKIMLEQALKGAFLLVNFLAIANSSLLSHQLNGSAAKPGILQQATVAPVLTGAMWFHMPIGGNKNENGVIYGDTPVALMGEQAARILPPEANLILGSIFTLATMPGAWTGQIAGIVTGRLSALLGRAA